jgi:hypothetical protein
MSRPFDPRPAAHTPATEGGGHDVKSVADGQAAWELLYQNPLGFGVSADHIRTKHEVKEFLLGAGDIRSAQDLVVRANKRRALNQSDARCARSFQLSPVRIALFYGRSR